MFNFGSLWDVIGVSADSIAHFEIVLPDLVW
jgi:hypothetical protein